jgi:hypothetical protein
MRVSTGTVSRWISGKRTPLLDSACRIDEAIGFPTSVWRTSHRLAA